MAGILNFGQLKTKAMKKPELEKKAIKYTAMVGSLAAFAGTAGAQIVYTDINPDEVYAEDDVYYLDVNNDNTDDFAIAQFDTTVQYGSFTFPAEGVVLLTMGSNGAINSAGQLNYLTAMALNDPIDASQSFSQSTGSSPMVAGGYVALFSYGLGPWMDAVDHYMGLTFLAGSNFHYGWCRMQLAADGTGFTVKDYAYDATPSTGLLAGQTVNSVEESIEDGLSMNVVNNTVQIHVLNSTFTNGNIQVINTAGQVMNSSVLNGTKTIDLNGYASGVYMVSVTFDQGQVNHKLFIR